MDIEQCKVIPHLEHPVQKGASHHQSPGKYHKYVVGERINEQIFVNLSPCEKIEINMPPKHMVLWFNAYGFAVESAIISIAEHLQYDHDMVIQVILSLYTVYYTTSKKIQSYCTTPINIIF